jgi:hypothetical protein
VLFNKSSICEGDAAARIVEAQSFARNGPGLAGCPADDEVHISNWYGPFVSWFVEFGKVAIVRDIWVFVLEESFWERFDLGKGKRGPA